MSQHQDDMSQVPNPGELVPEGNYQIRIAKVEEAVSKKGFPVVNLQLKIQNEGAFVGRVIPATCSLQSHALFSLKAFYNAVGYQPPPGQGHDPDNLLDGECWIYAGHKIVDGATLYDIPPYSIKSLQEGPAK